jgi:hypothetical protein
MPISSSRRVDHNEVPCFSSPFFKFCFVFLFFLWLQDCFSLQSLPESFSPVTGTERPCMAETLLIYRRWPTVYTPKVTSYFLVLSFLLRQNGVNTLSTIPSSTRKCHTRKEEKTKNTTRLRIIVVPYQRRRH